MSDAVLDGDVVRRRAGPWTPTTHRLLEHLRARGIRWAPRPLGTDGARETVELLPGTVPDYPLPAWVWSDGVLATAGRLLADLHTAAADFDRRGAVWRLPAHEPDEVICHNDFAPYNMVFRDGALVGVIDWDTASPGPRVWDLAYLAYRLVPLGDPDGGEVPPTTAAERARRIALLCDAYGPFEGDLLATVLERVRDLAAFTTARADAGEEDVRAHVAVYERDAAWLSAQL